MDLNFPKERLRGLVSVNPDKLSTLDRQRSIDARLNDLEASINHVRKIALAILFVLAILLFVALGAVLKAAGV